MNLDDTYQPDDIFMIVDLPPVDSKRSLGQGNVFTPVCHSVHRGGLPYRDLTGQRPPPDRDPPGQNLTPTCLDTRRSLL